MNHTSEALAEHIDTEDKLNSKTLSSFELDLGQRGGWLINESGLYSLILSSKLPTAKKFKHWITNDVLPSIRKHGMYAVDDLLDDKRDGVTIRDSIGRVHEQTAVNEIVLLPLILCV